MEMGVVVSGFFKKKVGVYSFPTISFARLKVETPRLFQEPSFHVKI